MQIADDPKWKELFLEYLKREGEWGKFIVRVPLKPGVNPEPHDIEEMTKAYVSLQKAKKNLTEYENKMGYL
jgi:hypothetical protein